MSLAINGDRVHLNSHEFEINILQLGCVKVYINYDKRRIYSDLRETPVGWLV